MTTEYVYYINQQPIQKELVHNLEETTEINSTDIAGYRLVRSFFNNKFFNVFAVNDKDELLVCMKSDMDFEEASYLAETMNAPYECMIPPETELVEVQVKNEPRIFKVVK
ncbi:MAG: hypothetical protein LC100_15240 [Chitinophagales bacterium]|nr:hypothetical protein [Chitinophagales bacterium]